MLTEKSVDGNKIIKGRLVARRYQEKHLWQTDSTTCNKECLRLILSSALLQGKPIERDVYIASPPEADKDGNVWKLRTCVHGLNDARCTWYLRVRYELAKLNAKPSKYDAALFY